MPLAELTSTQAPHEPVAGPNTPHPCSPHTAVGGHGEGFGIFACPEAGGRQATTQPTAKRSRGLAAFHAIALWLLRVLANSAGAWALAAGAPLDSSNAEAMTGGIVTASIPTDTEPEAHGLLGRSVPAL